MKPLNILGKRLKVVFKELLAKHGAVGFFYYDEFKIEIEQSLQGDEQMITILHELGHALFDRASLNQTRIPDDVKEIIVDLYAKVLVENFHLKRK